MCTEIVTEIGVIGLSHEATLKYDSGVRKTDTKVPYMGEVVMAKDDDKGKSEAAAKVGSAMASASLGAWAAQRDGARPSVKPAPKAQTTAAKPAATSAPKVQPQSVTQPVERPQVPCQPSAIPAGLPTGAAAPEFAPVARGIEQRFPAIKDLSSKEFTLKGYGYPLGWLDDGGEPALVRWSETEGHAVGVGSTGRGKSTGIVDGWLLAHSGPAVVVDIKGEEYRKTSLVRSRLGPVIALDPFGVLPAGTERAACNPLEVPPGSPNTAFDDAMEAFAELVYPTDHGDMEYWSRQAQNLMVAGGIIKHRRGLTGGSPSVAPSDVLEYVARSPKEIIADLQNAHQEAGDHDYGMRTAAGTMLAGSTAETTFGCYVLGAAGALKAFRTEAIKRATTRSTFAWEDVLLGQKGTVYIVVPETKFERYASVVRLWLGAAIRSVFAAGDDPSRNILMMVDEAGNIGRMTELERLLTLGRSKGMRLVTLWQDRAQMNKLYGEVGRFFISNARLQIHFGTSDLDDSKFVAEMSGFTKDAKGNRIRRMEDDDVRLLPRDRILVVPDCHQPLLMRKIASYEDHPFVEMLGEESREWKAWLATNLETATGPSSGASDVVGSGAAAPFGGSSFGDSSFGWASQPFGASFSTGFGVPAAPAVIDVPSPLDGIPRAAWPIPATDGGLANAARQEKRRRTAISALTWLRHALSGRPTPRWAVDEVTAFDNAQRAQTGVTDFMVRMGGFKGLRSAIDRLVASDTLGREIADASAADRLMPAFDRWLSGEFLSSAVNGKATAPVVENPLFGTAPFVAAEAPWYATDRVTPLALATDRALAERAAQKLTKYGTAPALAQAVATSAYQPGLSATLVFAPKGTAPTGILHDLWYAADTMLKPCGAGLLSASAKLTNKAAHRQVIVTLDGNEKRTAEIVDLLRGDLSLGDAWLGQRSIYVVVPVARGEAAAMLAPFRPDDFQAIITLPDVVADASPEYRRLAMAETKRCIRRAPGSVAAAPVPDGVVDWFVGRAVAVGHVKATEELDGIVVPAVKDLKAGGIKTFRYAMADGKPAIVSGDATEKA